MDEMTSAFKMLADLLPSYEERPQQVQMAEEVFSCLKGSKNLLVEAGTGIGKSFAYLIPAILSGKKTVISTASIALQEQLSQKDLMFLQKSLVTGSRLFTYSVLKGKNNYLCIKREREYQQGFDTIFSGEREEYDAFSTWALHTETGDRDELSIVPDFWNKVCGDSDDCNTHTCPFYSECYYYRHYRNLYKKDLIVVNHHLLIYDLLLDFSLIPFHHQLIVDESHQLDQICTHVLGSSLTHERVVWLLFRLKGLGVSVDHLYEPVGRFFKRNDIPPWGCSPIPDSVIEELKNIRDQLALDRLMKKMESDSTQDSGDAMYDRVVATVQYMRSLSATINGFIGGADADKVHNITVQRGLIVLKSSLVESSEAIQSLVDAYDSVVMTSATLSASGTFHFIKERLGIADEWSGTRREFTEVIIGTPFDYRRQALLYLEKELPAPIKENSEVFLTMSLKRLEHLIKASQGRALVLFTSYAHLDFIGANLHIEHPFKAQGSMPPALLIDWFKKTPHSVLLATTTFWQGIDIKGDDLCLVIIMKMPFSSPGDPIYDERCRRLGKRWFRDLALPSAILLMKQGLGRLIRGTDDYGVVAILDSRLCWSSYGKTVIASLPEMNIVHSINKVEHFFEKFSKRRPPI